jgi:hypothetical protein
MNMSPSTRYSATVAIALCVIAILIHVPNTVRAATVYNLGADWSDTFNPNGVWAYRGGDEFLPHVENWTFSVWDDPVPGWGNTLPFIFKSYIDDLDASLDWLPGDIVVHTHDDWNGGNNGPAVITWTSPLSGVVDISGGVWMGRDIDRGNEWRLSVRGEIVSTGTIFSGDTYSRANPFRFELGSGGPRALRTNVEPGDVVTLEIVRTSFAGEFVGVELQVTDLGRPDLLTEIRVASVDICWQGLSNQIYQVQYSSTLTTNSWVNLGNPIVGNGANCVTDIARDTERRFYRIVDAQ